MNKPNKNLVLCVRVKDLESPSDKSSKKDICSFCKEDVWINQKSLDDVSPNGLPVDLCCNDCLFSDKVDISNFTINERSKNGIVEIMNVISCKFRENWK